MQYIYLLFFLIIVPVFFYLSFIISKKINLIDNPDNKRKLHFKPVLLVGGIFFEIIFVIFFIIFFLNYKNILINFPNEKYADFFIIFISISVLFLIGILDDKKNINPLLKLLLVFLTFYFSFYFLSNNFLLKKLIFFSNYIFYLDKFSVIFTSLCFMLLLNASNMMDGINSLASIIFAIWIFIINIFLDVNSFYFFINCILIYALLIFSFINFKNKCFLGDGGCFVVITYIGYLTVYTYNINLEQNLKFLNVESVFLLFLIPGVDMFRLFLVRIFNRKSPFAGDRSHFHHVLSKKYNVSKTLLIYSSLVFIPWLLYYLKTYLLLYLIFAVLIVYFYLLFKINTIYEKN
jgi:UDP-GlcNAc:undecaprenyl-phosphate GlcNAc-1-phosphate transferase